MKIVVTGSTGLVGSALIPELESDGHEVVRLVRAEPKNRAEVAWDPEAGTIDLASLEGADAVVHLAGENIAEGSWTDEKKKRIRESRVKGTRLISESLAQLPTPPRTLISASAIGFYGNRGDEVLTEESASGSDYLAVVCREWEEATTAAAEKGVRVVNLRFGIILSTKGGALAKMLTPFQVGVGGRLGSGKQFMSWVDIADVTGAIRQALRSETLSGPVNVVAPNPITNRKFTKTLGRVLSRPTLFPVPAFAVRLAFGEMADALLLASQRVEPAQLKKSGYEFKYTELESSLRHVLNK
jgi:uncharacterized protein (TIGR01777 family)